MTNLTQMTEAALNARSDELKTIRNAGDDSVKPELAQIKAELDRRTAAALGL